MTPPTRGQRIYAAVFLFVLPTAFVIDVLYAGRSKYATPALLVAAAAGLFLGETWHRWRRSHGS